jgi:hypothetical protein
MRKLLAVFFLLALGAAQQKPEHYSGAYTNGAFGYTVTLPADANAYADARLEPNGFVVKLKYGRAGARAEFMETEQSLDQMVRAYSKDKQIVSDAPAVLGTLNARKLILSHAGQRQIIIIAVRQPERIGYAIEGFASGSRAEMAEGMVDALARGFRITPIPKR